MDVNTLPSRKRPAKKGALGRANDLPADGEVAAGLSDTGSPIAEIKNAKTTKGAVMSLTVAWLFTLGSCCFIAGTWLAYFAR